MVWRIVSVSFRKPFTRPQKCTGLMIEQSGDDVPKPSTIRVPVFLEFILLVTPDVVRVSDKSGHKVKAHLCFLHQVRGNVTTVPGHTGPGPSREVEEWCWGRKHEDVGDGDTPCE